MEHLLRLIQENKVVRFHSPIAYNPILLLKPLVDAGYHISVISDDLPTLTIDNVTYNNVSKFSAKNNNSRQVILLENIHNSLDILLIISHWLKSSSAKLVIHSNKFLSLFPYAPYYIVPNSSQIQIRYTKDYFPNTELLIYDFSNLIYKTHNSSIQGNFLVLILSTYRKQLEDLLLKMNFDFVNNKRNIVIAEINNPNDILDMEKKYQSEKTSTEFICIFDCMLQENTVNTLTGGFRKEIGYVSQLDANIRSNQSTASEVIVYRMISQETFFTLPVISTQTIPLHHLMIDLYERKLNPFDILLPLWNADEINFVYTLFLNYGILDISMKLTDKAQILRKLPFGLRPALLCIETNSSVLPALIDNYMSSPFLFSPVEENILETSQIEESTFINSDIFQSDEEIYNIRNRYEENKPPGVADYAVNWDLHVKRYYNRFRGASDYQTFLNMYNDSLNMPLKKWCQDNHISYIYMNNVYSSIALVNKILQNYSLQHKSVDIVLPSLYNDRNLLLDTSREIYTQYISKDGKLYTIDSLSINLIERERPSAIVAIITSTIAEFNTISFSYVPS